MSKTIQLTTINIKQISIDYSRQAVIVLFSILDDQGGVYKDKEATFFVTPPDGYQNVPEWFQLPAAYVNNLLNLKNDAEAALTARFLT